MPKRPDRYCAQPGCKERVKGELCSSHQAPPIERPSSHSMGYDAEWRSKRAMVLRNSPFCAVRGCRERASHVDHIKPHVKGQFHDMRNLQALCHSHHSQKTAAQDGGFGNRKR